MTTLKLADDFLTRITEGNLPLPSLPEIVIKIQQCERNPDLDAIYLARVIEQDPATAAQLLRIANSPLLRRANEFADLSKAISALGVNYCMQLASNLAMQQLFHTRSKVLKNLLHDIWQESTQVAVYSYILARTQTCNDNMIEEEALASGLLHKIGALPIISLAEKEQWLKNLSGDELAETMSELKSLITDQHAQLGFDILKKWNFPESLCQVPLNYLKPLNYQKDTICYTNLVHVARLLYLHSVGKDENIDWQNEPALECLGWMPCDVDLKLEELKPQIEVAQEIFR